MQTCFVSLRVARNQKGTAETTITLLTRKKKQSLLKDGQENRRVLSMENSGKIPVIDCHGSSGAGKRNDNHQNS